MVMCTCMIIAASSKARAEVGASTYKQVCSSCHEAGISGAPILEDELEWSQRVAQGADSLYASIINGKCKLLVQDFRPDLSDETIKAAVDFMVSQSR